ncbi:MAG: trehalose-phosphatase [Dehalococcoidales bacterium]|nr:trehalose-phosphatase [Dehalococcoidales bacterium]
MKETSQRLPFGLITDLDGTISPIAPTFQQARVSPLCRHYLTQLSKQLALVAVISGRPAAEARDMVGINDIVYYGNHGLECWRNGHSEFTERSQPYFEVMIAVVSELTSQLQLPGMNVENKGVTASIHYRLCPDHHSAEQSILTAIATSPHARNLRVIREKMGIDLLPPIEESKGTAVRQLIGEHNLRGLIYLGDDLTDVDAFHVIHSVSDDLNCLGLAIGIIGPEIQAELEQQSDLVLYGVREVERFLEWLCQASRPDGSL